MLFTDKELVKMICKKCVMPDTKPGFSVDEQGICNACHFAEFEKTIDWEKRWDSLRELAFETCGRIDATENQYHCVIPVSGGKDSTFLAMLARDRLGLVPLCVNVAPCEPTERGERNLRNLSKLGFDIFRFYPNQKIMPKLVKRSFYEDGDPCTSHEFMLYSVPVRVAMQYKIPLIVWAENASKIYGNFDNLENAAQQKNIGGLWGRSAKHWLCEDVGENDLIAFEHPTAEEIKKAGVTAIYMSDYVLWDSRKVAAFAIEHGLETRPVGDKDVLHPDVDFLLNVDDEELIGTAGFWHFEQLDDESPVIGHYLKWMKFHYSRGTDQACRDIRRGYITREQGFQLVKKYDGHLNPQYIMNFCKYINITESEFHRVCNSFYDNPVKFI